MQEEPRSEKLFQCRDFKYQHHLNGIKTFPVRLHSSMLLAHFFVFGKLLTPTLGSHITALSLRQLFCTLVSPLYAFLTFLKY